MHVISCIAVLGLLATVHDALALSHHVVTRQSCTKVSEECSPCVCGHSVCTVVQECSDCNLNEEMAEEADSCNNPIRETKEMKKPCCEAECENGGTTLVEGGVNTEHLESFSSQKRRSASASRLPSCRLFFRFPKCACLPGFGGQCCENKIEESCATKQCSIGSECQEVTSCRGCPTVVKCVRIEICPLDCPPETECNLAPRPCPPGKLCPVVLVYQCISSEYLELDPCKEKSCPSNTNCVKRPGQCAAAPCPPSATCVPIVTGNPCSAAPCPAGTHCRHREGVAECEPILPPRKCPSFPLVRPGIGTKCDVQCRLGKPCGDGKVCCRYGCSIRCVKPVPNPPPES